MGLKRETHETLYFVLIVEIKSNSEQLQNPHSGGKKEITHDEHSRPRLIPVFSASQAKLQMVVFQGQTIPVKISLRFGRRREGRREERAEKNRVDFVSKETA